MKIQIDTKNKTIKIEESILLSELIKNLDKLFPNDSWKEYKLETTTITNWTNPIIIEKYPVIPNNPYPWHGPIITCGNEIQTGTTTIKQPINEIYNLNIIQ